VVEEVDERKLAKKKVKQNGKENQPT